MKTILVVILSFIFYSFHAQDKSVKTVSLSVKGNCDECKNRIENAADIKGVKLAVWDETTQALTVTYKPDKVTLEQIEKAIIASGHDVGMAKSTDANYNKLPNCCKYRDKKCEIPKK